jgi:hypothetical protein
MACYISSNDNRFYAALESSFGHVAGVTAADRFTAVSLLSEQVHEIPRRRDKTGSRTDQGMPGRLRRKTSFSLKTYLYSRDSGEQAPRYGALLQAALGAEPAVVAGGLSLTSVNGNVATFGSAHGLKPGEAITVGGELRFVSAVADDNSVVLNAPLTEGIIGGAVVGGTRTYAPATTLRSVSLYDRWSPADAAQRIVSGATVDELVFAVNGDFHEITISGQGADLLDNKSFESGDGNLTEFPEEPELEGLFEFPVPGHLGQAWVGSGPSRVYTLSKARIKVKNNVDLRSRDFGVLSPRCIVPGDREVTVDLELYSQNQPLFDELLQAARTRTPLPLMVQLGEQAGGLCGVYLPRFVPAVPEFLDEETRLRWRLKGSLALGTAEDEVYVSFG